MILRPQRGVPRTGQTTSYRTGDDGTFQAGVRAKNTRATEFIDNGNGTAFDLAMGLLWTKNPGLMIPGATGVTATNLITAPGGDFAAGAKVVGSVYRDAAGAMATACNITAATAASPCVLTVDNVQGLITGDLVLVNGIVGNMGTDVLNGHYYYVVVNSTNKTLTLYTDALMLNNPVSTTGKTYTSAGTAVQCKFYVATSTADETLAAGVAADRMRLTIWTASAAIITVAAWRCFSFNDAVDACLNLVYAERTDWRISNLPELVSCMDFNTGQGANNLHISPLVGAFTVDDYYWSGNTRKSGTTYAHKVIFNDSANLVTLGTGSTGRYHVRPVCGGIVNA